MNTETNLTFKDAINNINFKNDDDPINIHNVGIYFRSLFNDDNNYFDKLIKEHQFQLLTESNKITNAYRKGIYLSNVYKDDNDNYKFNLLRCSTNLNGPTDNFKDVDIEIINKVSNVAKDYFDKPFKLNHVLAQVYYNDIKKAKISDHSDKTKDMDNSGIIAFVSFYNNNELYKYGKQSLDDPFDYVYKTTSILTKLKFNLKNCVKNNNLVKSFEIKLYPNSVFIIPLSTNRLYTHSICPSTLDNNKIPTRMGYVIRCSKTQAIYKDNKTFILDKKDLIELNQNPEEQDILKLKELYYNENKFDKFIDYGLINFSLNKGDYMKPNYTDKSLELIV